MNRDIDGATTAIEDHHDTVFDHLCFNSGLTILATLDACALWLETEQEIARVLIIDDVSFLGCLAHEEFVFFAPEGRYGKHPSDLRLDDFAHLLREFFDCFLRDVFQTL